MKPKVIILDMDGTCAYNNSKVSSWQSLGHAAGIWEEWNGVLKKYEDVRNHSVAPEDHIPLVQESCRLLAGMKVDDIVPGLTYELTPGLKEFCDEARRQGICLGLVTYSIDLVAHKIAGELGIEEVRAVEICHEGGYFTGEGVVHVPFPRKGEIAVEVAQKLGASPEETAFIGDSPNDRVAWEKVGFRWRIRNVIDGDYSLVQETFDDFYGLLEKIR